MKPLLALFCIGLWSLPCAAATTVKCEESGDLITQMLNAIDADDANAVQSTLKAGACLDGDVNFVPLVRAAGDCRLHATTALLAKHANPNQPEYDPNFGQASLPLNSALVSNCQQELVSALVKAGADLDKPANSGDSIPLEITIDSGNQEAFDLLLQKGARVQAHDLLRITAHTSVQMVDSLISHGADVNAIDVNETRPLHLASSPEVARTLLAHGADLNARARNGETALWKTYLKGDNADEFCESRRFLVQAGIDVNAINRSGDTALLDLLRVNPGDFPDQVFPEYICAAQAIIDTSNAVQIDARDYDGRTILMYSSMWTYTDAGRLSLLKTLINRGADVNARDNDGKSVLEWAKQPEIRKLLIDAGAK